MKYFKVKDLIEELLKHDQELPCIITDGGKDHHYGVTDNNLYTTSYAYFGNDNDAAQAFAKDKKFLNIGTI